MRFDGFPFVIGWELTLACTLRCNHCGSSAGLPRRNELTTDEALALCDQFPSLLVQEVDFTGGEPLLRPDWEPIALRLGDLGISTNILTNGLNLDTDTVARMKGAGISAVGISLDGMESTHDYTRNHKGSFNAVMKSIALIQKAGLSLNVITTVNPLNLPELPDIIALLQSIGVKKWRLQSILPLGRVKNFKELQIDEGGILELGFFIRDYSSDINDTNVQIICGDGLQYIVESDKPWRGCSAGIVTCGITSDGKIKGCLSMPDELIEGDIRSMDLWDIWFSPESFKYNRNYSHEHLGDFCKSCDKGEECLGGCSSNSFSANGCFHNDPYCFHRINKKRIADDPLTATK